MSLLHPLSVPSPLRPQSCPIHLQPPPVSFMQHPLASPPTFSPVSDSESLPDLINLTTSDSSDEDIELPPLLSSAVQLAFDVDNPEFVLDAILGHPTLRALVRAALTSAPSMPASISSRDIVNFQRGGQTRFQIRPVLAIRYHDGLVAQAEFIHSGLNNYDRWSQPDHRVPPYLPERSLQELRVHNPTLSLLLDSNLRAVFESAEFDTLEEALDRLGLYQRFSRHYTLWIAHAIAVSVENYLIGNGSCINFGASIGMSAIEFLDCISPTFVVGGYEALKAYINNTCLMDEMDFKLVRVIHPHCDSFLVGSHDERSYITTWPIPLPANAAPTSSVNAWRPSITAAARQMVRRRLRELRIETICDGMDSMMI